MPLSQFLDDLDPAQLADRLRLALEGASLGVWDWDLRDNRVRFDRRWCEMLGLVLEETPMTLETWSSRVHPDDRDACTRDLHAYLAGERAVYENTHRMRHADGRWIYILDRGRVSQVDSAGRALRFTATHFDCTAAEEARRLMENQQKLLTGLLRNLPTAVAMLDPEGRYLATNERWDAWFRLGPDPAGFRPVELGRPLPTGWSDAVDLARAGSPSGSHEQRCQVSWRPQASWLRWSMWPGGQTESGGPITIVRFDDVTEERDSRARRDHDARLSALGTLAAGIAHQLNTPLQTLLLNTRMAQEELELDQPDLDILREILSESLYTAADLSEVVTAMRVLSGESAGDELLSVELGPLVGQVAKLCASRFRAKGVRLELHGAETAPTVPAREAEVAQILVNLVANAFEAAVQSDDPWVRIVADSVGGRGRILVQDSGDGVPDELVQSIMEPFFTTKAPGQHTGLGLSLSQSLAQSMDVSLRLEEGMRPTTFSLIFSPLEPR